MRDTYEALERALTHEIAISPVGRAKPDTILANVLNEVFILEARRRLAIWALGSETNKYTPAFLIESVFSVEAAHAEMEKLKAEIDDDTVDPIGDVCGFRRFLTAASQSRPQFTLRLVSDPGDK
jgi:hypothetical protein